MSIFALISGCSSVFYQLSARKSDIEFNKIQGMISRIENAIETLCGL